VTAAIETHTDYDTEYRNIWPDGSVHWVFVRGRATYSSEGTPPQHDRGNARHHRSKHVEEKLREAEEQFRTLAENMSQFAWMADAQG
jgi:PAS domain-containing protein